MVEVAQASWVLKGQLHQSAIGNWKSAISAMFLVRAGGAKAGPVLKLLGEFSVAQRWQSTTLTRVPTP